ncbi:hypothetical protein Dimus_022879 [Dionaea muscipula]
MENSKKKKCSSSSSTSSSSIAMELFGPKEPSSSSSASVFGSFVAPPDTGKGRASQQGKAYSEYQTGDPRHGRPADDVGQNKDRSSYYQQETIGPCYLNSSIYYGGQEVHVPVTCNTNFQSNKDERDDDKDGSNQHDVSRGNWWQGSVYY